MLLIRLSLIAALLSTSHLILAAQIPERVQSPEEIRARRLLRGLGEGADVTQQDYVDALESGHRDLQWAGVAGLVAWDEMDRRRFDARALRVLARSDDPKTREYGIWLLGKYAPLPDSDTVDLLIRHIGSDDDRTRWRAIRALTEFGAYAAPARDALLAATEDESLRVRTYSIRALGAIGVADQEVVATLLRLRDLRSLAVEEEVHAALRAFGAAAVPGIRAELRQGGWRSLHALSVLSGMGPDAEPAIAEIAAMLERSEGPKARAAAEALGGIGPVALPEIRRLIETGVQARRNVPRALRAFDRRPPLQEVAELLLRLAEDPDAQVRAEALRAINPRTLPEAVPLMLRLLREDSAPPVRAAAVAAMERVEAPTPPLIRAWAAALRDPAADVREAALTALDPKRVEADAYWPDVARLLDDESRSVSYVAALRLEDYGATAQAATTAVIDLLESADPGRDYSEDGALLRFIVEHAPNDDRKREVLTRWLRSPDYPTVQAARKGLAAYGSDALPAFRGAITADQGHTTSAGFAGVQELGPASRETLQEIMAAARSCGRGCAGDAVRTLVSVGGDDPDVQKLLLELTSDPLEETRTAAVEVIRLLEDRDLADATLQRVLDADPSPRVRRFALRALPEDDGLSDRVRSLLIDLLSNPREHDRELLKQAARTVTEQSKPAPALLKALLIAAEHRPDIEEQVRGNWKRPDLVPVRLLVRSYFRLPEPHPGLGDLRPVRRQWIPDEI